jgi:hypothetical protein
MDVCCIGKLLLADSFFVRLIHVIFIRFKERPEKSRTVFLNPGFLSATVYVFQIHIKMLFEKICQFDQGDIAIIDGTRATEAVDEFI